MRPVFTSTGMWTSPARRTASGRPVSPWRFDAKSFGFSASESTYGIAASPIRCFSRADLATSRLFRERTRNHEAPTSHPTAAPTVA